jgi:23S rRNA (uracil1939-C5)-methyltransferase
MNRLKLTIHDLGSEGEGVGRIDGYTMFVDGALPGEEVEILQVEQHKRYGRGKLLSVITPSPERVKPPCKLFGTCGGCQLMHLDYSKQLTYKQKRVSDALQRIGNLTNTSVNPCEPSPAELNYRNKIQLPVRNTPEGISLGLYAVSSHHLVPITHCQIHASIGNDVYKHVSGIIKSSGITAYDPETGKGVLRHLLIRSAIETQQVLVILVATGKESPLMQSIADEIMKRCPEVKGVVLNVNPQNNNIILGHEYITLKGSGSIFETLDGITFKISPSSFFQVNPGQAVNLYNKALALADLQGSERVLDAFCGVGTLALFFARHTREVVGVECVAAAIDDAKANASLNKISNATFVVENAETYIRSASAFDVVLLNPPRKGCEASLLKDLVHLAPAKIIYISCNPATLARDLAYLCSDGYQIDAVQPFDMFPQTAHVETVVKLSLKMPT